MNEDDEKAEFCAIENAESTNDNQNSIEKPD